MELNSENGVYEPFPYFYHVVFFFIRPSMNVLNPKFVIINWPIRLKALITYCLFILSMDESAGGCVRGWFITLGFLECIYFTSPDRKRTRGNTFTRVIIVLVQLMMLYHISQLDKKWPSSSHIKQLVHIAEEKKKIQPVANTEQKEKSKTEFINRSRVFKRKKRKKRTRKWAVVTVRVTNKPAKWWTSVHQRWASCCKSSWWWWSFLYSRSFSAAARSLRASSSSLWSYASCAKTFATLHQLVTYVHHYVYFQFIRQAK